MSSLIEKLDHLESFEKSCNSLTQIIGCDSYQMEQTISHSLYHILQQIEETDIEDQQHKQRLENWIQRYPRALGIVSYECSYEDHSYEELETFPFLLSTLILERKFKLLPFFIENGKDYFSDDLRGGLLQDVFNKHDSLEFYHENPYHKRLDMELWKYSGITPLACLVCFHHEDTEETELVEVLDALKNMDVFQRHDVQELKLLAKCCLLMGLKARNRFHFLVEFDPESLLVETDLDTYKMSYDVDIVYEYEDDENFADEYSSFGWITRSLSWKPQLIFFLVTRRYTYFEIALTAALKVFGKELGLLLLPDNSKEPMVNDAVLLTHVKRRYGIDRAWNVIETSLRDTSKRPALFSLDNEKGIYPFMLAAESLAHALCCDDGDIKLTLLYHLLREDLSWSDMFSQQSV